MVVVARVTTTKLVETVLVDIGPEGAGVRGVGGDVMSVRDMLVVNMGVSCACAGAVLEDVLCSGNGCVRTVIQGQTWVLKYRLFRRQRPSTRVK